MRETLCCVAENVMQDLRNKNKKIRISMYYCYQLWWEILFISFSHVLKSNWYAVCLCQAVYYSGVQLYNGTD